MDVTSPFYWEGAGYYSQEIWIVKAVPSKARNSGGEIASSLTLLAMTERACLTVIEGACLVMTRMFRNVVRDFGLVRTTLKGRTMRAGPHNDRRSLPARFIVIASEARQSRRGSNKYRLSPQIGGII